MLSPKDVPPQETSQRGAESRAERAVVDAECHGINGCPERSIRYWDSVELVDFLPCLQNAREKDCGANVRAGELQIVTR